MNNDKMTKIVSGIIETMEQGVLPWRKAYSLPNLGIPVSYNGRPYRGMNRLTLMIASLKHGDNRWIGFHAAKALGGSILKGAKGCPVTVPLFKKSNEDCGEEVGTDKAEVHLAGFRLSYVFNLAQTRNIPASKVVALPSPNSNFDPIQAAEDFIAIRNPKIETGMAPAYSPQADTIFMPPKSAYDKALGYYDDLAHEMGHFSHHRICPLEPTTFGSDLYSKNELVAELFACFVRAELALDAGTSDFRNNSVAYLKGWVAKLKAEPSILFGAASEAQRALDWYRGNKGVNTEAPSEQLEPAQAA